MEMSSPLQKAVERQVAEGKPVNETVSQGAADAASILPSTTYGAQAPEMGLPRIPEIPMPDVPDPRGMRAAAPVILTEEEKKIAGIVTQQVLQRIDPLLKSLQNISNEAANVGIQQKLQELERGINERIESRVNKINAIIGRIDR